MPLPLMRVLIISSAYHGAGAIEIELATQTAAYADTLPGLEQGFG